MESVKTILVGRGGGPGNKSKETSESSFPSCQTDERKMALGGLGAYATSKPDGKDNHCWGAHVPGTVLSTSHALPQLLHT